MKAADNLGKSLNLKETEAMVWQMFLSFLPSSSLSPLHIRVTFCKKKASPCLSVEWRNVKSVFEWLAGCGECLATSPQIMMITWDDCLVRYSSKYPVSRSLHSKPSAHAHPPLRDAISLSSRQRLQKKIVVTQICVSGVSQCRPSLICLPKTSSRRRRRRRRRELKQYSRRDEPHKKSWFMIQKWKRFALIAFILWVKQSDKLLWTRSAPKKAI